MTGWRLGYGVMRPISQTSSRACDQFHFLHGDLQQMAGIEAVRGDQSEPEKMRQEFQRRRDVFVKG